MRQQPVSPPEDERRDEYAQKLAEKTQSVLRETAEEIVEERIHDADDELLENVDDTDIICLYKRVLSAFNSDAEAMAEIFAEFDRHKEMMIVAEMETEGCEYAAEQKARERLAADGIYDPDSGDAAAAAADIAYSDREAA